MHIFLLIIGDEILSGKRQDKHFNACQNLLSSKGLMVRQVQYIADEPEDIIEAIKQANHPNKLVFCFGGIGATPDDHTRQAAASALNLPLIRHPEAVALIEGRFGQSAYPKRVLMADIPKNASIIPNPVNQIPGFSCGHIHFFPGFPEMAHPMMAWVVDTHYSHLFPALKNIHKNLILPDSKESELIDLMQEFVSTFPNIRLSSLPSLNNKIIGPHIDLGLTGLPEAVDIALDWWKDKLKNLGKKLLEP